jgi:TetR/AcrR family transcriptional repressor of nem operon
MRYRKTHKQQTHQRIVGTAARRFRREGISGVGVGELMQSLALTHGGFYAHFANKQQLVIEALRAGFADSAAHWARIGARAEPGKALPALVERYLSLRHRDTPDRGCMLPTLATEITHQPGSVRHAFTEGLRDFVTQTAAQMPGMTPEQRTAQAQMVLAGLAGTMLLARAVDDPEWSDALLTLGRQFYGDTEVIMRVPGDIAHMPPRQ